MSDITPSVAPAEETTPAPIDGQDPTPAEEGIGSLAEPEAAPAEEAEAIAPPVSSAAPPAVAAPAASNSGRGRRKVRLGKVISAKMAKTIVVVVENRVRHPLYGKFMKRSTKFKAHDEESACGEGDTVEIMETRPLSKEKRWRVVRVIEKAK